MTNLRLSKATISPGTVLMPKHTGWAAAQSGKPAWIIDSDNTPDGDNWFTYTTNDITRMHEVRRPYCERLREGHTL